MELAESRGFLGEYASARPVPGGGSAASLAGALGCALLAKCAKVALRRKGEESGAREISVEAEALVEEFLRLEQADITAYRAMVDASKAQREAPEDPRRASEVASATRQAIEVPLRVAEEAARALGIAEMLVGLEEERTASDQITAVSLLLAALDGSVATARINLPWVDAEDHAATAGALGAFGESRLVAERTLGILERLLPPVHPMRQ
ncbi:MAG: cyclodeaminase/cyclohydrolase family protein [Actinomycetota bacterium]